MAKDLLKPGEEPQSLRDVVRNLDANQARDIVVIERLDRKLREMLKDPRFLGLESFLVEPNTPFNIRGIEWQNKYGFISTPKGDEPLTALEVMGQYTHLPFQGEYIGARNYFLHIAPQGNLTEGQKAQVKDEIRLNVGTEVYPSDMTDADLLSVLRRNYQRTAEACFTGIDGLPGGQRLSLKAKKLRDAFEKHS